MAENAPGTTRNAMRLQQKLEELRMKLVRAKAVMSGSQGGEEGGLEEEEHEKLVQELTRRRTEAFLGFQGLQLAVQAGQANQELSRAFNLEEGGIVTLEKEEEQYVRGLLEEQRELAISLCESNRQEVEQELEVMEAQAELAGLYCRYRVCGGVHLVRRHLF